MIEYIITGDLVLESAWHVGAAKAKGGVDAPWRRANDGRLLLPGRAIGGSLRTLATRMAPRLGENEVCHVLGKKAMPRDGAGNVLACGCLVCRLFGDVAPTDANVPTRSVARASNVWVYDAYAQTDTLAEDPQTHVRDGVGIDRQTRTAAKNVKFNQEVLPAKNVTFPLQLKVQAPTEADAKEFAQLLAVVLAEWEAGRGRLGGNVARGLGAFTLKNVVCRRQNLTVDSLMAYLAADDVPWQVYEEDEVWLVQGLQMARENVRSKKVVAGNAGTILTINFNIHMENFSLVNDPVVAALSKFDHAPQLTMAVGERGEPVLPGSSLRGALRSRAEKIARTLATIHAVEKEATFAQARTTFYRSCPACDPLKNQWSAPLANCNIRLTIPKKEEVAQTQICLSCQLFGNSRRGSRLWVADGTWQLPSLNINQWQVQDFLAIDRFTGGGMDGAKFDAAPLVGAQFQTALTLHNPQAWELGWLALVLRDLAAGGMRLGFGAAKGYGKATVSGLQYTFSYLHVNDLPDGGDWLTENAGMPSGLYQNQTFTWEQLLETQNKWVSDFHEQLKGYKAAEELDPMQDDTFFQADSELMMQLYGLPNGGVA